MGASADVSVPVVSGGHGKHVPSSRVAGALAATSTLIRFLLRRDRIRAPVWLLAISGTVASTAVAFSDFFTTDAEVAARTALIQGNPAMIALTGPGHGLEDASLDNLGPAVVNELSATTVILVALMSIFLVVRHTRAEEESGRAELVHAGVVGRYAAMTATLVTVGAVNLLLGALLTVGLAAADLPWEGSLAFGASMAMLGLVFAAVAALSAQLTEYSRGAVGIAVAVFGVAFALRAIGDAGDSDLSWYSPVGWAQAMRPYADERWWPALLLLGLAVAVAAAAYAVSTQRDVGAGLTRARPGRAHATPLLTSPFGLAFRLQRGTLLSWGIGMLAGGVVGGFMIREAESLTEIDIYQQYMRMDTGEVTDSVTGFWFLFIALLASGFALQSVLRARSEETSGRAEPVLAAAVPRWRWAGSHLLTAIVGTTVLLVLAGLGTAVTRAVDTSDSGEISRLLGAQLAHLPAVVLFIGLAFALFGVVARAAPLVWVLLGFNVLAWMFGPLLGLPDWLMNLSQFEHSPQAPADEVTATPLLAMSALAVGLMAVGLAAFQRRDVESS